MARENPFATPESDVLAPPSSLRESAGARGQYRSGDVLVHAIHGVFADRCVRCDAPVESADLRRELYWHSPWVYLLVFPGVLLYALVALAVRRRATVHVGLCARHRDTRRTVLIGAWLGALASVGSCALTMDSFPQVMLFACAGLVASAAWGIHGARVVSPIRIDDHWVHLRGVCRAYLDRLPEWPHRR